MENNASRPEKPESRVFAASGLYLLAAMGLFAVSFLSGPFVGMLSRVFPGITREWAALATNVLLKNLVHRIRPYVALENLSILVSEPSDWSFPSGHATASFAAAWALFRLAPKKVGVPALLLAILIALSRLYEGVHYPTDVLAGAAIGILSGESSVRLIRSRRVSRLFEK